MPPSRIASGLLQRRESLEKSAFLGKALAGAGNYALRAAKNEPIGAATTLAGGVAFGPALAREAVATDPVKVQRAMQRRALAQQMRTSPMKTKIGSIISREDALQGLAIRRSLEKTASKGDDLVQALAGRVHAAILGGSAALDTAQKRVVRGVGRSAHNPTVGGPRKPSAQDAMREKMQAQIDKLKVDLESATKRKTKAERFMSDPMRVFLGGAALSAGAMAVGGVGMGAATAMGKGTEAFHASQRNRHYKNMLKVDPTLKRDPKARAYFGVLHRASPFIATEPHVAAATVRSMMESPEGYALHPKFVKDLLEIEEKRQKTRYPAMRGPAFKGDLPGIE